MDGGVLHAILSHVLIDLPTYLPTYLRTNLLRSNDRIKKLTKGRIVVCGLLP